MNIPSRVNPLGYDNSLPPGYMGVEFLEGTRSQYITTDYYQSTSTGVEISADCELLSPGGNIMAGACGLVPAADGSPWAFGLYTNGYANFSPFNDRVLKYGSTKVINKRCLFQMKANSLLIDGVGDTFGVYGYWSQDLEWSKAYPLTLFAVPPADGANSWNIPGPSMKAFRFTVSVSGKVERDFIPALDHTGKPCMFDLVTKKPFYNAATTGSDFTVGLTLDQVRNLNLPPTDVTKTLTLSLPAEAGFDYRAQKALSDAGEKGWLLTLQYESSGIPYNIRKVEFLEGTAADNKSYQWMNTGVQMADNVGIKAKFSVNRGRFATGVGAWYSDSTPAEFLTHVSTAGVAQHHYLAYGWGTPKRPMNRLLGVRAYAIQEGELNWLNSGKAIFRAPKATTSALTTSPDTDVPVTATYTLASPPDTPILNYDIYLFALNNNGTPYMFSTAPTRQRIYEASISVDDAEHTHFVAAIDQTGTPYMFDTIGSRLVENSGTGAFAVGIATVEEVRDLYIPEAPIGASLKLSVPADTPDSAIDALHAHNPDLQIEIIYR